MVENLNGDILINERNRKRKFSFKLKLEDASVRELFIMCKLYRQVGSVQWATVTTHSDYSTKKNYFPSNFYPNLTKIVLSNVHKLYWFIVVTT